MMDISSYVKLEESERLYCYDDKTGKRLEEGDMPQGTPTIGVGITGPNIIPGLIWTQEQSDEAYGRRLLIAEQDAASLIGAAVWSGMCLARQAAWASMAYNLGLPRLSKFVNLIADTINGDWQGAHDECLNSNAARELPARYKRHALMLLTGEFQPGYGG